MRDLNTNAREDARRNRADRIISATLRAGVVASAAILILGAVLYFVRAFTSSPPPHAAFPHTLNGVLDGLVAGDPLAVMSLGLLVLLLTPVARVLMAVVTFALERDRLYTLIASAVLLILVISFLLGRGGA